MINIMVLLLLNSKIVPYLFKGKNMSKFDFHNCSIIIQNGTIEKQYLGTDTGEVYPINEPWVENLRKCRCCKQFVSDEVFSHAFYRLEQKCCSSNCSNKDYLNRYACCEQAQINNCVCIVSTICPIHGERHFGSHE